MSKPKANPQGCLGFVILDLEKSHIQFLYKSDLDELCKQKKKPKSSSVFHFQKVKLALYICIHTDLRYSIMLKAL